MRTVPFAMMVLLAACCGRKQAVEQPSNTGDMPASAVAATAPVLVYRTKAGGSNDRVPVLLSDDRTSIVSYPHPRDLRTTHGLPLPTDLGRGYLLDNRGIGPNVAFLRMTYAEYAALDNAPSLQELDAAIEDRDPLLELCDCGRRGDYTDVVKELTALVKEDALLTRCKRLK